MRLRERFLAVSGSALMQCIQEICKAHGEDAPYLQGRSLRTWLERSRYV